MHVFLVVEIVTVSAFGLIVAVAVFRDLCRESAEDPSDEG